MGTVRWWEARTTWALQKESALVDDNRAPFSHLAAYRIPLLQGLSPLSAGEHRGCSFRSVFVSDVYRHMNAMVRNLRSFFFFLNRSKSIALSQLIKPQTFPVTLSKLQCAIPCVRPHSSRGLAFAANVRFNSCHIQPEERHSRCHILAHVQPLFCKSASSS